MSSVQAAVCSVCGAQGPGKFCANCGAPREGTNCRGCRMPISSEARFCPSCGLRVGTTAESIAQKERTPWLVAGAAFAGLLAVILIMVFRDSRRLVPEPEVASATAPAEEAPPDISNMSPRERFNRLYNRVMRAAQSGVEATATRFPPMALRAYAQLDSVGADARYHAALLKVHTGEVDAARALTDTNLAQNPG